MEEDELNDVLVKPLAIKHQVCQGGVVGQPFQDNRGQRLRSVYVVVDQPLTFFPSAAWLGIPPGSGYSGARLLAAWPTAGSESELI